MYVGSLSADVSELELKRQFGAFGPINEVKCYNKGERCATAAGLSTAFGDARDVKSCGKVELSPFFREALLEVRPSNAWVGCNASGAWPASIFLVHVWVALLWAA